MQPLKFKPLLKQTIWGGNKIVPFKHLDSNLQNVGESWEISGVPGDETIVANGEYEGKSLNEVLKELQGKLVGEKNYARFGNEFPLLIKFIDANDDLSIQVHPTDELAQKRGKSRGKTEMWYLMESAPKAYLNCGMKTAITPQQYKEMVANNTICDAISNYNVKRGDSFFIPAGRIHSIGKGCFILEIQQTSDVTYRIYDFNRKDKDGNTRELHTEEAAECINYTVEENYRTNYVPAKNVGVNLATCPFFTTNLYDLDQPMTIDLSQLDSFVILICTGGKGTVTDNEGNTVEMQTGDSILVPATTQNVKVEGVIELVQTYV